MWGRGWGEREVNVLAAEWNTVLFCLGHERADNGILMRGPRAIILNSDHEMATVVPLDLADLPSAEGAMHMAVRLGGVGDVPPTSDPR